MYIDRAYSGRKIYGVNSDRDIDSEPYCLRHDESRMGLRAWRSYGCEIDEFSPVSKRILAIERSRKNTNPQYCSLWTYEDASFCRGLDTAIRSTMAGGIVFAHYREYMTTCGSIKPARISRGMGGAAISRRAMGKLQNEFPQFEKVAEVGGKHVYPTVIYTTR